MNGSRLILLVLLLALFVKAYALAGANGFYQGDSYEYLDRANKLVYGFNRPTSGIRSWFYSFLLAPPVLLLKLSKVSNPDLLIRAVDAIPAAFAVGSVYLTYLLGKSIRSELSGLASALLLSVNVVFNYWSVSPTTEAPSVFFALLAYLLYFTGSSGRRFTMAGFSVGVATMIRYQSAVFLLPLLFTEASKKQIKTTSLLLAGFALAMLLQGLLDLWIYGAFLHSAGAFFYRLFLAEEGLDYVVNQPLTWYLATVPQWLSAIEVVLALLSLLFVSADRKGRTVLLAAACMLAVMSPIPRKELRFMVPVIPFLCVLAGVGLDVLKHALDASLKRVWVSYAVVFLLLARPVLFNLIAIYVMDYAPQGGFIDAVKYVVETEDGAVVASMVWAVGGNLYIEGTGVKLKDADPLYWKDRARIRKILDESDYFIMWESWVSGDSYVREIVNRDFTVEKEYKKGVILYKKISQ